MTSFFTGTTKLKGGDFDEFTARVRNGSDEVVSLSQDWIAAREQIANAGLDVLVFTELGMDSRELSKERDQPSSQELWDSQRRRPHVCLSFSTLLSFLVSFHPRCYISPGLISCSVLSHPPVASRHLACHPTSSPLLSSSRILSRRLSRRAALSRLVSSLLRTNHMEP